MTSSSGEPGPPRPVFGGCLGMVAAAVVVIGIGLFMIVFLESGANTGQVVLRDFRSYDDRTVEFVGEGNFFVVRLSDGTFLALSDLDAANREAEGARCRVQLVAAADPELPAMLQAYRGQMSDEAAGWNMLFRETCNAAVYDVAGRRLDDEGPNLDRFFVGVNDDMELVVDTRQRTCTQATPNGHFTEVECPI